MSTPTPLRFCITAPQRRANGLFYVRFSRPGCGGTASGATAEAAHARAMETVSAAVPRDGKGGR